MEADICKPLSIMYDADVMSRIPRNITSLIWISLDHSYKYFYSDSTGFRFNLSYPNWIETGFLANPRFLRYDDTDTRDVGEQRWRFKDLLILFQRWIPESMGESTVLPYLDLIQGWRIPNRQPFTPLLLLGKGLRGQMFLYLSPK